MKGWYHTMKQAINNTNKARAAIVNEYKSAIRDKWEHYIDMYRKTAFTHNYIVGFDFSGDTFIIAYHDELTNGSFSFDQSRHNIRIRFDNANKYHYLNNGVVLMKFDTMQFNADFDMWQNNFSVNVNKGHYMEYLLCVKYGYEYKLDSTPYYVAGDIVIDNISYQCKFDDATLATSLETIENAYNRMFHAE